MKRVQEKEKYWEERLNINIREEFYIYLYLCEGVTVKKKMLPMEKQFQTYKNWKEHIINIGMSLSLLILFNSDTLKSTCCFSVHLSFIGLNICK